MAVEFYLLPGLQKSGCIKKVWSRSPVRTEGSCKPKIAETGSHSRIRCCASNHRNFSDFHPGQKRNTFTKNSSAGLPTKQRYEKKLRFQTGGENPPEPCRSAATAAMLQTGLHDVQSVKYQWIEKRHPFCATKFIKFIKKHLRFLNKFITFAKLVKKSARKDDLTHRIFQQARR